MYQSAHDSCGDDCAAIIEPGATTPRHENAATDCWRVAFPTLVALGLTVNDVAALKNQGFVYHERRNGKILHKLRFRLAGRQRAKCVTPEQAMAIEAELSVLQKKVRMKRRLEELSDMARRQLRDSKLQLEPLLEERGYYFHGRQVRRRRVTKVTSCLAHK
jgi:hypothetical protein